MKMTAAEKKAVRDYVLPHNEYQAARKFGISTGIVRAIVHKGVMIRKKPFRKRLKRSDIF